MSEHLRSSSWTVAPAPADLLDRRVEITGPTDATMAVNALNSGAGLRTNVDVGLPYLEAWLGGTGAVGIHNLMADAATAEISRSQICQWLHNVTQFHDRQARSLFEQLALADDFVDLLTVPACEAGL